MTQIATATEPRSAEHFFREYVKRLSVAQALSRAVEAHYLDSVPQESPMLDIGCGFGEFAQVLFRRPCDVGLDVRAFDLKRRIRGVYRDVLLADARRMPLPDNSFQTVFSVSVLEHIPGVEAVLGEAARVLRPGGKFAITVPLDAFGRMLAMPRMLRRVGLDSAAGFYADRLNGMLDHINLWPAIRWREELEGRGLRVDVCEEILSPRATALLDLMLPSAFPSQLGRLVTKHRFVFRPPGMVDWLTARFASAVNEKAETGSNLFVLASKP